MHLQATSAYYYSYKNENGILEFELALKKATNLVLTYEPRQSTYQDPFEGRNS